MTGRNLRTWFLLPGLLALLASCAGIPEHSAGWSPADILPPSCSAYLSFRVRGNEELMFAAVGLVSEDDILMKGLEETEYLYIGIQDPGGTPVTYVTGSGTYSSGAARAALTVGSDWRRRKGPYPWYLNEVSGIQVSFPGRELFCMSDHNIEEMLLRLAKGERNLPPEVKLSMGLRDIVLYIPVFEPAMARIFLPGITAFPAERIFLQLTGAEEGYVLDMTAVTGNEKSSGVLSSALKLVLLARAKKTEEFSMTEFLREVTIETSGKEVHVSGVRFSNEDLLRIVKTMNRKSAEEDK